MEPNAPRLPSEVVENHVADGRATLIVDAGLYPLDALYGAAYVFIDRCYVLLDRPDAGHFRVSLTPKGAGVTDDTLRAHVGEFANELLSCAWRHQIVKENRAILEQVTNEAIAGAMGPPSLDDLANFDFTEEPFEDPLGIAMSWEEKYKKTKPEGSSTGATSGATTTDASGSDAAKKGGEGAT